MQSKNQLIVGDLSYIYRVHCYDEKNAFLDIEWTVTPKVRWVGSPWGSQQNEGQNTDCMYMDWGYVIGDGPREYENEQVEVNCLANNGGRVVGTVKNDGSQQFY